MLISKITSLPRLTGINWQSHDAQVQPRQANSVNYGLPVQSVQAILSPTRGSYWFAHMYRLAAMRRAGAPRLDRRQTGMDHQRDVMGLGTSSGETGKSIEPVQDERQTGAKMEPAKVHSRLIANTIDWPSSKGGASGVVQSFVSGTKNHLANKRAADIERARFNAVLERQKNGAWVIAPAA